MKAKRLRL